MEKDLIKEEQLTEVITVEDDVQDEPVQEPINEDNKDNTDRLDKKEILRELSRELELNLFEAEGLAELKNRYKEKEDSLTQLQKQLEDHKNEINTLKTYALRDSLKIREDKFDDALTLASNRVTEDKNLEQALREIADEYKDVFVGSSKPEVEIGSQVNEAKSKGSQYDSEFLEHFYKNRKQK